MARRALDDLHRALAQLRGQDFDGFLRVCEQATAAIDEALGPFRSAYLRPPPSADGSGCHPKALSTAAGGLGTVLQELRLARHDLHLPAGDAANQPP